MLIGWKSMGPVIIGTNLKNDFKFNAHPKDPSGTTLATNFAVNWWVDSGLPAEKLVWFSN